MSDNKNKQIMTGRCRRTEAVEAVNRSINVPLRAPAVISFLLAARNLKWPDKMLVQSKAAAVWLPFFPDSNSKNTVSIKLTLLLVTRVKLVFFHIFYSSFL